MLTSGNATINPESCGFLKDNQLANEIIMLDIKTLTKKLNINQLKKFLIFEIGLRKGSYTLSMNFM